ncbi:dynamin family protein (macronuclear) [Tetrahymena thermophila SB210]|uniref:Dynamin family protein n=1 Tax=Tetrahymena thermophila (strain SB210) TaxID=312017 RepID=I7MG10_TETTS|nr:dynamin family protein [Tetrahymena thermophila SB210]EAS00870.2 dynamin family protein [Tetrahymena thermophila SB210]|eukprot:XP_001021115.2 dynamin family protein [Tetrahymena thermophila SB210]
MDADQINNQDSSEKLTRNLYQENAASLQKMKQKIEIGIQNKEIWNENLLNNMIQNAENYLANQKIYIILLGAKGSGKTTLLNSILGDEIVPYYINKSNRSQIIIQVGFQNEENYSIVRCNPQTFNPNDEEENSKLVTNNIREMHQFIEQCIQQDNQNNLQRKSTEEYAQNANTLKVFQIRFNSSYLKNFPQEIRHNILFVDTPGIHEYQRYQSQIFINSLKNLQQNSSPVIKYYLWVTSLTDNIKKYEKTIIENVFYQLHLSEKTQQQQILQESKQDLKEQEEDNQLIKNIMRSSESSSSQSQRHTLIDQICISFKASSEISESESNIFFNSVNQKIQNSLKDEKISFQSSNSVDASKHPIEVLNSEITEDNDVWIIDKSQAQKDQQELKLKYEQISNLKTQKINRQLGVVFNSQEEKDIFQYQEVQGQKQLWALDEFQDKYLNMLEKSMHKPYIKVSALPILYLQMYQKYKNESELEKQIIKQFYISYKQSLKLKNESEARKIISNINFETDSFLNLFQFDLAPQINNQIDLQINTLSQIKSATNIQKFLFRQICDLYDYKQMKKRLRIQEIIDKSSIISRSIILNQQKRDKIGIFLQESLPIIHNNHQQIFSNNLQNIYQSSLQYRKSQILPKIEEIYQNHKSYQLFDKVENQLNEAILEYFSEAVQSLANSMITGDKLIEANKDIILQEIQEIDAQLESGIKSIIIDFKKRSLQDANNQITSNICLSLQKNFSFLGSIIGTSSLFTGLGVLIQRIAGKPLIGSGPLGLGVGIGMTILSTIFFVQKREKKLQESKQIILDFFEKIEEEQLKINQQLIQSYQKVYKEVIMVITDYLKGITTINLKQLIDEQKNLFQQDKQINSTQQSTVKQEAEIETESDSDSESDCSKEPYHENSNNQTYNTANSQLSSSNHNLEKETSNNNYDQYQSSLNQQFLQSLGAHDLQQSPSKDMDEQFRLKLLENSHNFLFCSEQSNSLQQCISNLEISHHISSPVHQQKNLEISRSQNDEQINNILDDQQFKSVIDKELNLKLFNAFQDQQNVSNNIEINSEQNNEQDVFYSFSSTENDQDK